MAGSRAGRRRSRRWSSGLGNRRRRRQRKNSRRPWVTLTAIIRPRLTPPITERSAIASSIGMVHAIHANRAALRKKYAAQTSVNRRKKARISWVTTKLWPRCSAASCMIGLSPCAPATKNEAGRRIADRRLVLEHEWRSRGEIDEAEDERQRAHQQIEAREREAPQPAPSGVRDDEQDRAQDRGLHPEPSRRAPRRRSAARIRRARTGPRPPIGTWERSCLTRRVRQSPRG